jgi:ferritin-like metal-binding protein YciE
MMFTTHRRPLTLGCAVAALAYFSYQTPVEASRSWGNDTVDTHQLFEEELVSLFSLEIRMREKLLEYAERAQSRDVRDAFLRESERTTEYIDRLRQVFMLTGLPTEETLCKGLEGMLDDAEVQVRTYRDGPLMDMVLVLNARKLEYHAMASYATLSAFARQLKLTNLVDLLDTSLDEHGMWDQGLYDLSKEVAVVLERE